ncbi:MULTISPECIES: TonB-dependent receptor [Flavobacteriaceae]|uniref:TonB-dependent receptor n=2 Tax=Flagellimonas TaxID=444459 RepID=A0ABT5XRR3_9FLAO|nr:MULTISPECIES: TonB-dependent receptor [Flavobacteriaceae]MBO0356180.1 TonB-dependent receptor [Allomuricauda aurea]MDF0708571.1 TonB-dependent receptor [[Muricauda] okinawensis]
MKCKLILLVLIMPLMTFSQDIVVSGFVSSADGPQPFVNVIEKGTSNGTTTDIDGNYSLSVNKGAILIFSSLGFKTQEIPIDGRSKIDVVLVEDAAQLDEVVVQGFTDVKGRARKRLESIQTMPESVTAVTSQQINVTGIEDVGSFLTQIPGISYGESQDPGTVMVSVRGIPQIRYGPSPIATVIDGVYMASADLNTQTLFDIDQIEVIKGAQGLFYGKNAIGGAVIITTKQPKNGFQGKINAGYGNGNAYKLGSSISGSIKDNKSYYRLGVNYSNFDGLINNTTLDEKVDFRRDLGIRGQLKFRLGNSSLLSFTGQHNDSKSGAITFIGSNNNPDFEDSNPNSFGGNPDADFLGEGTLKSTILAASFETAFKGFKLLSHTSYSDVDLFYDGDYLSFAPIDNYGPIPAATQDMTRASRTLNEELRLVSSNPISKFKWNLGLFYQNINSDWDTNAYQNNDPNDLNYTNTTQIVITNDDNKLNSIGLFGFFEYDISNKFNISVGIRNEWETLENIEGVSGEESKRTYNAFQPKLSASYKIAKENMLYASYSRGFRSGGYNPIELVASGIEKEIRPEFTNSFEVGLKNSFWNNRFIINLAYFNTVFEDQQVYRFGSDGVRTFLGTINFEESKASGFEIDTKLRLSKNFDILGGASFIDTEITKAFEESAIGNKIPFAPQSSFYVGLFGNFNTGENSNISANVNVENKGKKYWFADDLYGVDQENVFQDPYTLVNTKLIYSVNNISFAVWGKNIFDTQYNQEWWPFSVLDGDPTGGPIGDVRTPSQPATYGVEISYRF